MKERISILKSPIALPADAPQWWQLIPHGQILIVGDDRPLIMDDQGAPFVLKYFADLGRDIVIDYEHQTLTGGKAPAAGWIKEMQWRGQDGLWVRTEWTEAAAAYIAKKEYRYYSPVMLSRKTDQRIVAVVNVALTNEPKTRNIQAIAAKMDLYPYIEGKESPMIQKLRSIFKLAADADEAAVTSAVEALVTKNEEMTRQIAAHTQVVACKGVLDALQLPAAADEKMVVAKISGLAATGTAATDLSAQVASLTAKIAQMEAGDLTAQALKNGQTSPEELDKWGRALAKDHPEQFKLIVLSRPIGSVVPVQGAKVIKDGQGQSGIDDVQLSINKMLGIDTEVFKQFGPKGE